MSEDRADARWWETETDVERLRAALRTAEDALAQNGAVIADLERRLEESRMELQ
jgi:hypothetical protein